MSPVIFMHGQGVATAAAAEEYLTHLRRLVPSQTFSTLFYGPMIEKNWFLPFAQGSSEGTEADSKAERDLLYLQSHWDTVLDLNREDDGLAPSGTLTDNPLKAVRDTWLYSARYLLHGPVHALALTEVISQVRKQIIEHRLSPGSILLVAHSLGTVVALDVMQDSQLRPYFSRFVSVGSPLSALADAPFNKRLLPPPLRACPVPWIDVADKNDFVVSPPSLRGPVKRLGERPDFTGKSERVTSVTVETTQGRPHGDYFVVEDVLRGWIDHLV